VFLETFLNLLSEIDGDIPNFPPTDLYSEGWLLRLVVDWFSSSASSNHPLSFPEDGHWFSEARLPSAFLARFKGDPLAELHTNADGVIGHFVIGQKGKTDLNLSPSATHFVILEAKLYSGLSKGVARANYYDQAARSVACMAEVLRRADLEPDSLTQLAFYVLAPRDQIKARTFSRHLDKKSIEDKVARRISPYEGERDDWFKNWFVPTLREVDIQSISWEGVLDVICQADPETGASLEEYYSQCLNYNK
jgi:hypothetical protein